MFNKFLKWLFEIVGRNNKPRELVEPEPIEEGPSQLALVCQAELVSLLRQKDRVEKDIEYFKKRSGITMQDRRQVKHLHEELDGFNQDIEALNARFESYNLGTPKDTS